MKSRAGEDSLHRWGHNATKAAPRLTREREVELIRAWLEHADSKARDVLVRANLQYVMKLAHRVQRSRRTVPLEDIVAAGNMGLLEAIEHYTPQAGPRFISLAKVWIVGAMSRVAERHERGDGEELDVDNLPQDDAGDSLPEDDALASERAAQAKGALERAMKALSPRERLVIRSLLRSLQHPQRRSTTASAKALGVSPRRIRKIEMTARAKLKRALRPGGM